ncbi:MAG: class I SAM-dependent methyltransferase [Gammaproteobacteria bacterium]|nr:class I SAM-dependent methyltransferase [Gammaproteobacteria bacterium]MBI5616711.1 class I SAM-dependent methyltransferase [Gammaproteobacteria bacterium]
MRKPRNPRRSTGRHGTRTPHSVAAASHDVPIATRLGIPDYLRETYWWAYLHPVGVRVFERQWLVNLILWGNFARLRDAALTALGTPVTGRVLQVACVYGDFTPRLLARLDPDARLDVVDVAPIQLDNLAAKLGDDPRVRLVQEDSSCLSAPAARYDAAVVFFLLHEQPAAVRRRTLAEALRVLMPGGRLVIVDYHLPRRGNPLRYVMRPILRALEPFAEALWEEDVASWLPEETPVVAIEKATCCGGLYQLLVATRAEA